MKKYSLVIVIITITLLACGKKGGEGSNTNKADSTHTSNIKIDSLAFEVDTFHVNEKEANCKNEECTTFDVYYERIRTSLLPVHDSVNRYVDTLMLRALNEVSSPDLKYDLKKRAKEFITASNDPEYGPMSTWDWSHHTSIIRPVAELISVSSSWGGYVGGAHGMYYFETANFFTNSGKLVTLADLFTDTVALHKIGLKYFKKDNELEPDKDIIDQGWDFPDAEFKLNENFDITTESITWQFNNYEIGPYSSGAPTVKVPMSELTKILKVKFTDVKIQ